MVCFLNVIMCRLEHTTLQIMNRLLLDFMKEL